MENKVIADIFSDMAELLGLEDYATARFEVRAYQKAAMTIGALQEPVEDIYKKDGIEGLMQLPGIGKTLAAHIEEYLKTGKIKKYERLRKKYPVDMRQLTSMEGMGAKKAMVLYKKLGVRNISDLKKAVEKHKVSSIAGFGPKSEELIKRGLDLLEASKGRLLLGDALPVAEEIVKRLSESGLVANAMVAGSARRWRETVGDLDILALSDKGPKVMDFFVSMPEVSRVVVKGSTKTTVQLKIGTTCDLRVIAPESFPAALQYFTGSKDHNIQVRTIAIRKGYKLNEYGLFKGKRQVPVKTEADIYAKLGMQIMPPEMREARGEVKLAQEHKIPRLVELKDLKGDLHMHARGEGVTDTLEEMVGAARGIGLEYIVVANHTKSLPIEKGMNDAQFLDYFKKVDKLNDSLGGKFRILKGAEVDILKDGTLDLKDSTLKEMDCVVASVHSNFRMAEDVMTARIVRALDSGHVHVLGHPTGRMINTREAYALNLEKVFEAAERNKVALEVNSFPDRLDLNDTNITKASGYKVMFAIDSDSHRVSHFADLRYGIGTARRGWLTKERVLNAMSAKDLLKKIKR